MIQYITRSGIFGFKREIIQAIEEIKSEIMPKDSQFSSFTNEDMDSNSTHSESDLVEDVLKYFSGTNTKMSGLSYISGYLYRFPEIAELSHYVAEIVHQHFDSTAQLSLEVHGEINSEGEYLALCLRMSDYDDTVMDKIRSIRELYAEDLAEMSGWFLLTTDYMPPR
jgi:hypothetical protein